MHCNVYFLESHVAVIDGGKSLRLQIPGLLITSCKDDCEVVCFVVDID